MRDLTGEEYLRVRGWARSHDGMWVRWRARVQAGPDYDVQVRNELHSLVDAIKLQVEEDSAALRFISRAARHIDAQESDEVKP